MKITCVSDLHGFYPQLPGGDLLIVAGDLTAQHTKKEFYEFANWMRDQNYEDRIVIAGNHDTWIANDADSWDLDNWCDTGEFAFLCDSGTEFEGLRIWGSPWTLKFPGQNPHCMAFTSDTEEELAEKWAMIPDDTDILITHSPPYGFCDKNTSIKHCGSPSLKKSIWSMSSPLKIHIFGHIHEAYGIELERCYELSLDEFDQRFINASHVNERYKPVNEPITVEI